MFNNIPARSYIPRFANVFCFTPVPKIFPLVQIRRRIIASA
jgi:hypothetical protein